MSKTRKPTKTPARDRVVYEVISPGGSRRVEASTPAELKDQLTPLLSGLEPYAVQAVARLASMERATITAAGWSVRRVGVMTFQADEPPTPQRATARAETGRQSPPPPVHPEVPPAGPVEMPASLDETLDSLLPNTPEAQA